MLGAMGLCRDAEIRMCRAGEPCIVSICCAAMGGAAACRVGIARPLAERIMVSVRSRGG